MQPLHNFAPNKRFKTPPKQAAAKRAAAIKIPLAGLYPALMTAKAPKCPIKARNDAPAMCVRNCAVGKPIQIATVKNATT